MKDLFNLVAVVILFVFLGGLGKWSQTLGLDTKESDFTEKHIELAKTGFDVKAQVIEHEGYTTSYNSTWRIPNWVAWELTREETGGQVERPKREFKPDPQVVGPSATHKDYTKSGYARGHMFPAADARWSEVVMNESFYLSNVCPQNSALNGGVWERLEEKCRQLAREGNLYICSGPIVDPIHDKIGDNEVAVPSGFFKVLCMKRNGEWQGIGFVFPNEKCNGMNMFDQALTIDEVEVLSKIDFFYNLPDSVETRIESKKDVRLWQ